VGHDENRMPSKDPRYTHRDKFSSYMAVVAELLGDAQPGQTLMDMPAGAGHFGDAMAQRGWTVTHVDFNDDRDDFVAADMNKRLPFDDNTFDAVTCMEGIEHVLDPFHLVGELVRITRPGGRVILSTPNIAHYYSRIQFLLTGSYFNFNPFAIRKVAPDQMLDRGHISPTGFPRLRYLADYHGAQVTAVRTDRYKKKLFWPLMALTQAIGYPWRRRLARAGRAEFGADVQRVFAEQFYSTALLLGRTMIVEMRKREAGA